MDAVITIREIIPTDNFEIAFIIRSCLAEFGANKPGTVYFDPTTDHLFELFRKPGSIYFIAAEENRLLGGGGIFPSQGLPAGTCELVKLYLLPNSRGMGLGAALMKRCISAAREMGYKSIYLESMPELNKAVGLYEQFGFTHLDAPLGNTGHFGCDIWMMKSL
jgi:putative acetyltransferase